MKSFIDFRIFDSMDDQAAEVETIEHGDQNEDEKTDEPTIEQQETVSWNVLNRLGCPMHIFPIIFIR